MGNPVSGIEYCLGRQARGIASISRPFNFVKNNFSPPIITILCPSGIVSYSQYIFMMVYCSFEGFGTECFDNPCQFQVLS